MDARVWPENKLEVFGRHRFKGRQAGGSELQRDGNGSESRIRHDTIVQRLAPELFEIGAAIRSFQAVAAGVVDAGSWLICERREHFERGMSAVERRTERLNDADRAVVGLCIAPDFWVMRFGNIHVTEFRTVF